MSSVNKVILIGRLGKDPELRRTNNGTAVASFSLATSERKLGKNGEKLESTEWHNIVIWDKKAELVQQYLKKGRLVYIEGKLTTRSWDDKDGSKRYKTEIIASQVQFLSSPSHEGGQGVPMDSANFAHNSQAGTFIPDSPSQSIEHDGLVEDDLPF